MLRLRGFHKPSFRIAPKRNASEVSALKCESNSPLRLKRFSEAASSEMKCDPIRKN